MKNYGYMGHVGQATLIARIGRGGRFWVWKTPFLFISAISAAALLPNFGTVGAA
ncbi:MAG TPA: hypothetical protein VMW69_06985 [Spirochaetia bacterium]|nr:hypothetical protein [Spirochaetia bacterium]